jgi:hypothetical protein
MSLARFQQLRQCFALREVDAANPSQDAWFMVRALCDAFNACRIHLVRPGAYIVVDECMSAFLGLEAQYSVFGIPHKTKIPRKPKGVRHAHCVGDSGREGRAGS